ncbi:MAG: ABC transporter ATP-binding protein [Chloroflexi bacterium]|nr:ABC transporter ATP-binding protein [Chloroflexota bacterium]
MVSTAIQPAVDARTVVKNFGETAVLRGLDLSLPPGEVTVLLGSNGAGKSTLLRILAMLTQADSGSVSIYGVDLAEDGPAARGLTGSVLHSPMLYADMTGRENLMFFASLYRLQNVDELIARTAAQVGIESTLDDRVRTLSHGFQKRVALARALMHDPRLLLLDEPESGLDSQSVSRLDDVIDEYRKAGRTVVMTTHIVEHGLEIADRAVVLSGGVVGLESSSPGQDRAIILAAYSRSPDATPYETNDATDPERGSRQGPAL